MFLFISKQLKVLLVAAIFMSLASCSMDEYNEVCRYNAELTYHYNRENSSPTNVLHRYVSSISEYIFDEQGILVQQNNIRRDECELVFLSDLTLPAGNYSVIAWGNRTGINPVDATVGVTHREDMLLAPNNPHAAAGVQANGDRLFYGYRTFSIAESGVSRTRVNMLHSHMSLIFRVRWISTPPANRDNFYALMEFLPSEYAFMPEFVLPMTTSGTYTPALDDTYPNVSTDVMHYIPGVHEDKNIYTHRVDSYFSVDQAVEGEFVSYRIRNNTHPTISLYNDDGMVMKKIDLYEWFSENGIELDKNMRQEFAFEFIIDGDQVTVVPIGISDWFEGGIVG